jgi:hypothetical protein
MLLHFFPPFFVGENSISSISSGVISPANMKKKSQICRQEIQNSRPEALEQAGLFSGHHGGNMW